MEWGARALGNRVILADLRRVYMPTSSIERSSSGRCSTRLPSRSWSSPGSFHDTGLSRYSRETVYHSRGDPCGRLGTPADREPQTNSLYWEVLKAFEKQTGIAVLLNTSFNENEPILHRPAEALDCFLRTKMDVLVMGTWVVTRNA